MKFLFKEEFSLVQMFFGVLAVCALNDDYYFAAFIFVLLGGAVTAIFSEKHNPDKYTKEDLKEAFIAGINETRCTEIVLDELSDHCALNSEFFDKWIQREKDKESK